MKYSVLLMFTLSVLGVIDSQAEEVLPPQFNFDRYSKMVDKSPFAIATAVAAPAATPDFAKDLYIANAARSSDGDMVTLASTTDHNFKKYLTTKEPVDGYSLASIEWSDKVGETKVTIGKDGNFATITFNQALLSQGVPNAGVAARAVTPPMPSVPVPNAGGVPNPALSRIPAGVPAELQQLLPKDGGRPHSRGLIQRNPMGSSGVPSQSSAATKGAYRGAPSKN
ncbi:MAG TPA: hypothetical protein VHS80_16560 [Chthoniobacterales bacterium]|jgi:hypothetical protein|nr:hypothetical protein [Chthoniobacterales bacterium]